MNNDAGLAFLNSVLNNISRDSFASSEETLQPPIRGISAGIRIPRTVVASRLPARATAMPVVGPRVDAATRQAQYYTVVPPVSPALASNTVSFAPDYNPIYQAQFDNYLQTNEFERMYGPATRGQGAPLPSTPRF